MKRPLNRSIVAVLVLVASAADVPGFGAASAQAQPPSNCIDASSPDFAVECVPDAAVGHLLRQACSYIWVGPLCTGTLFPDPGYATEGDPSPGAPLELRIGALHEHSSYSDGEPQSIPADYYRAGRTGHNQSDTGEDTGVKLDFMFGSEHSDNAQIPITTNALCLDPTNAHFIFGCAHFFENDQYWKWQATLQQAREGTEFSPETGYNGFTGVRGFEWTNDYFNHMNVFFSTNYVNVKVDGSYLTMNFFWDWLRKPVDLGGGADALVTFNHPGGNPHLSPFDAGLPHTDLLAQFPGGGNWNDVAYVPDVDERVAGMEINGGEDIEFYVKALNKGWHIGPVAAEDEHELEWATSKEGKTLILARGRSPKDYYYAFREHRTVAIHDPLVGGQPGTKATFPKIHFYADGSDINDPESTVLGSTITGGGSHDLHIDATDLPSGTRVALLSNTGGGQSVPLQLGAADATGSLSESHTVTTPESGQDWYFAVICPVSAGENCGRDHNYIGLTAPIWLGFST